MCTCSDIAIAMQTVVTYNMGKCMCMNSNELLKVYNLPDAVKASVPTK